MFQEMQQGKKKKLNELKNIKSNQIGILSNARCLGEGVDVPKDGICFTNLVNQVR